MADVSIGGRLDFGMKNSKSTDAAGVVTKTNSLAGNDHGATTSRLTFKGNEDLGGGLKAGFEITTMIDPNATTTGDTIFNRSREAYVTVGGDFGTVKLGTFTNLFDGFVDQGWHNDTGMSATKYFPTRTNNAIAYVAPTMSGFTGGIALVNDKTTVDGATTAKTAGNLLFGSYAIDALSLEAGYGSIKTSDTMKKTQLGIKVGYDLGVAKLQYMYADGEQNDAGAKAGRKDNVISAAMPFGAVTVSAAYGNYKGNGADAGIKTTGYHLSADYSFSKRTSAYFTTGQKKEKTDGAQSGKTTTTSIGLIHKF